MIGEYKDLNADSGIADLPSILNYNNNVSRKAFDSIYDSDKGVLVKSVENAKGHIKMHHAEFVNLSVDNLIIKNTQNTDDEKKYENHEDILNRFSWNLSASPRISINEIEKFAHDTKMIVTAVDTSTQIVIGDVIYNNPVSLREELDAIENLVNGLAKNLTFKTSDDSISEDDEFISEEVYGESEEQEDEEPTIAERISKIEKRLSAIEYRLDTL